MKDLQTLLDPLVEQFESVDYIDDDPVSIPHAFDDPQDQEIIGLFAAILAWGQRKTILSKLAELSERMDNRPYRFVYDFNVNRDAHQLDGFRHRTFKPEDAVWLVDNLRTCLRTFQSIESMFVPDDVHKANSLEPGIEHFSGVLLNANPATPRRLFKHVARPSTKSACKRLCMYARWMTRPGPYDLGIWKRIQPKQLIAPLDVHSGRQARTLGLLTRKQNDWKAAIELTESCRQLNRNDPIRYDLALFGIGAYQIDLI